MPPIRNLQHWQFSQSYRWHDPTLSEIIRLSLNRLEPGIFFDIGANMGLKSLDPLCAGWRIIAFEPNQNVSPYLGEIISLNRGFRNQGHMLIPAAVGDCVGTVVFEIDPSSYLSSVQATKNPRRFVAERTISVNSVRMDQFLKETRLDPTGSIVKIDVEGYEVQVLLGWGDLLGRPEVYFIEVTLDTIAEIQALFSRVRFNCYVIDEEKRTVVPLSTTTTTKHTGTFDIVATRHPIEWFDRV